MRRSKAILVSLFVTSVLLFITAPVASAQDAAATYHSKCAVCHGADGKAATAMGKKLNILDFSSAEVKKQSDAKLSEIIAKGMPEKKMPAYGSKLSDAEIKQLVAYVRELAKGK